MATVRYEVVVTLGSGQKVQDRLVSYDRAQAIDLAREVADSMRGVRTVEVYEIVARRVFVDRRGEKG